MPVKREKILNGVMTLLVLRKLLEGPAHGYMLERYLSENLERPIPPGTIYVILTSLKRRRLVSVRERIVVRGRYVTNYELTDSGREFLLHHKAPLLAVRKVIDELIHAIEGLE